MQKDSLYCILFLHQTTTTASTVLTRLKLYCILFLHQTTTVYEFELLTYCCIASSFYIKPQRNGKHSAGSSVVLHPLSTSNHNCSKDAECILKLYCILFLHQTTTERLGDYGAVALYCILFLHQTTTNTVVLTPNFCCIASSFYIKPQRQRIVVVTRMCCIASSFYIKPQHIRYDEFDGPSCIASSFYIKPQHHRSR